MASRKTASELKRTVCEEIDRQKDRIVGVSNDIMLHPETGYRETRTASYVCEQLDDLGVDYRSGLALTGVKARLRGGGSGPTVAVLGELDALKIPEHPYSDPVTHAAHACGHNAQVAAMLGVGLGLQSVMSELCGDVVLFATPAEEAIETGWRQQLRHDEKIEFLVGKAELIRLGEFDDVDMAMMAHTPVSSEYLATVGNSHNGAVVKNVRFRGRSAHAGAAPWDGVNALKAATVALGAIDAHRESFNERDTIRVHTILPNAGVSVSAIPSDVEAELLVRARTLDALAAVSEKVDQALRGGALAMGAHVQIKTSPAYFPNTPDSGLTEILYRNCVDLLGEGHVGRGGHVTASTDVGDLSYVMPVVHPRSAGTEGAPHSRDYWVRDHHLAAVNPAKFMACTIVDLLQGDGAAARSVLDGCDEKLTREEYVSLRRRFDAVIDENFMT